MLVKEEYQSLLALLGRVEIKGVQEAQALISLATKLDSRIKNWFDGHVTGFKYTYPEIETYARVKADEVITDVEKAANLAETVVTGKVQ